MNESATADPPQEEAPPLRALPKQAMYAVWGYTEADPERAYIIAITPDIEIAVAVYNSALSSDGPAEGGAWHRVEIDARLLNPTGILGFYSREGVALPLRPLTRGRMLDLIDAKRKTIQEGGERA